MASPGREGGVPGARRPQAGKEREMRRERPQVPVGEESRGWLHRDQSAARRGAGASWVESRSWTPGSTEGARRGGRNAGLRRASGPRLGGAPTHRSRRQAVHVGSGHRSPATAGRARPTSQLQRLCRQRAAAAAIRLRLAPPPSQPYDLSPLTPPTSTPFFTDSTLQITRLRLTCLSQCCEQSTPHSRHSKIFREGGRKESRRGLLGRGL